MMDTLLSGSTFCRYSDKTKPKSTALHSKSNSGVVDANQHQALKDTVADLQLRITALAKMITDLPMSDDSTASAASRPDNAGGQDKGRLKSSDIGKSII
ncbi:hypothetical protein BSLG_004772 [Batrachochytrium salamandrivorans]|nr:hypothetical protein BSLG_004772 [Batrachochytrium salamandrivorans]